MGSMLDVFLSSELNAAETNSNSLFERLSVPLSYRIENAEPCLYPVIKEEVPMDPRRLIGDLVYIPFTLGRSGNQARTSADVDATSKIEDIQLSSVNFYKRFSQELATKEDIFIDRFQPFNWLREYDHSGYDINDKVAAQGKEAVQRMLLFSARETAVAWLPLDQWRESGTLLFRQLASLVIGTLGNTIEESADPTSVSYSLARESLWNELQDTGVFEKGFRPWNTSPYGYVGMRLGRWGDLANTPIVFFRSRLVYRSPSTFKLENTLTIPLPHRFSFTANFTVVPLKLSSRDLNQMTTSAYIGRSLGRGTLRQTIYAGIQSSQSERLYLAGFMFGF